VKRRGGTVLQRDEEMSESGSERGRETMIQHRRIIILFLVVLLLHFSCVIGWISDHPLPLSQAPRCDIDTVTLLHQSSSFESNALAWLSLNDESLLSATASATPWRERIRQTKPQTIDKVKRVIDASTVQLEKSGYVSLESVRGVGSTYILPDCFSYSPSYEMRRLLPKGTVVRLVHLEESDSSIANNNDDRALTTSSTSRVAAWIVRNNDEILINEELVRTGFAYVRKGSRTTPPDVMADLIKLERIASEKGLGIYESCDKRSQGGGVEEVQQNENDDRVRQLRTANFVAQFESLNDNAATATSSLPSNPGDSRGCSDFVTYEEALNWYETYAPYYGDVAKLDRNGDGVPCPGLPHTTNGEKYRIKRPNTSSSRQT
jgi:hypothetical protein